MDLSRCTRLHYCYISSVIFKYINRVYICMVQTGVWLKSACIYPDTINWLICIMVLCCQMLTISVLLLFYTIPFVRVTICIQYESGLVRYVSVVTVWESVCRTSVFVVKAYRNFVEQMSHHDDLLQSVYWYWNILQSILLLAYLLKINLLSSKCATSS